MSIYCTRRRISQAQEAAQTTQQANRWIGLALALLGSFQLPYYQTQINKVWDRYDNPPPGQPLIAA